MPGHDPAPAAACGRARPVALAVAMLLAFACVYLVFVRTPWGQQIDIRGFALVQTLNPVLERPAGWVRQYLPVALAGACLVLALAGLRRGRWRVPVVGLVLVAAAAGCAVYLRDAVLTRPDLGDFGYVANTFPSVNVATTAALTVAGVLLWRRGARRRWWAAALLVPMACLASVLGHAHRPSDVVGSVLLVGALGALAAPFARPAPPDEPRGMG